MLAAKNFIIANKKGILIKINKFMNTLISTLENVKYTENHALTNKSSGSVLLDLFGSIGALRNRNEKSILEDFDKAFSEDKTLALKMLFYARDVRGGQGERKTFRIILRHLANKYIEVVVNNFNNIVELGRWDDILSLIGSPAETAALDFIAKQFSYDLNYLKENKPVSLLGKWLPSENTSSLATRIMAKKVRNHLQLDSKTYRKNLSALRKEINIVETKMSHNNWDNIDFSQVPSRAGFLYRKAFHKHAKERYEAFMLAVNKGEKKINASVLYPYEIISQILSDSLNRIGGYYYGAVRDIKNEEIESLDMYWNKLPNYLENRPHNGLVVADTSGSMVGLPLAVSISLAIYFAEHNNGIFKNHFISFSENPQFHKVIGKNIVEKVQNLTKTEWGRNTNLQQVFSLILALATKAKSSQEDMPETVYVVSDMEFDKATGKNVSTNLEEIRAQYEESGYKMPELVFWNVNSRNSQSPILVTDSGVKLVSGCSPVILTSLLDNKTISAYDSMLAVLNNERYNRIVTPA